MYDQPFRLSYTYPALAFGGGSSSTTIKPPRGMTNGRIEDITVAVTVLFTAVTTPAFIRLGYSGNNAYFAELNMGTAAASAMINAGEQVANPIVRIIDMKNDAVTGVLTSVLVNFVAATGGSPAGTGTVGIHIGWW